MNDLDERYPDVAYLLSAYLVGDNTLPGEVEDYVATEGPERARHGLGQLRELLADPAADAAAIDELVRTATPWFADSGRQTLSQVADMVADALDRWIGDDDGEGDGDGGEVPPDVVDRVVAWSGAQGLPVPDDLDRWQWSDVGGGFWVIVPSPPDDLVLVVTPDVIRPIRPATESVADALAELGLQ